MRSRAPKIVWFAPTSLTRRVPPHGRHLDRQPFADGQCHPRPGDGRRAAGQFRPPGRADGHGRNGRGAVGPAPEAQPRQPALARPRPLRAVQRPCVDAAVFAAAPERLCTGDERAAQLPPAAQQDPGPPRGGRDARRRDHHRPAGPGHQQRGGHGAGREAAGARVQPPRACGGRPPHLRLPGRRLHDGRHQPRKLRAGRCLEAEQADGAVRRQRHQHRRRGAPLVRRQRAPALRGLRLGRDRRHRRPGRGRGGRGADPGAQVGDAADADHLQHHHRQGLAAPRRHRQGARRGAGQRRSGADTRSAGLELAALRHPRAGLSRCGTTRRAATPPKATGTRALPLIAAPSPSWRPNCSAACAASCRRTSRRSPSMR